MKSMKRIWVETDEVDEITDNEIVKMVTQREDIDDKEEAPADDRKKILSHIRKGSRLLRQRCSILVSKRN